MVSRTTKTTATRPFADLSPSQFEAVVRQVLSNLDGVVWEAKPDPVGHLGSDAGQDIRAVELARAPKRTTKRPWLVQVKRYEKIHPKDLEDIIDAAIPAGSKAPHAFIVAVSCNASKRSFDTFDAAAKARGVKRPELWTKEKLNDFLNDPKNALTATFYFGDGSAIPGTVPIPFALDRSVGRDAPLLGRAGEVADLLAAPGDIVIVGPAGSGKSRLAAEIPGRRFLTLNSDANAVADSLRIDQPTHVVLDDAGLDVARLDMLLELRQQGYAFRIVATTWAENLDDVRVRLPDATRVDIAELERPEMDQTLRVIGIGNYYVRTWILDLAEGRPGWAIALADLAKGGRIDDVLSGRGLIERIGPYLNRANPGGGYKVMAFLGVLAAIGPVGESELPSLDRILGVSPLDRLGLIREAAAVGMLELRGTSLAVVPEALRPALVAHVFFEGTARMRLSDVLAACPDRGPLLLAEVIDAAHAGSTEARAEVDRRLPDLTAVLGWARLQTLVSFATLDEAAARRALAATRALEPGHEARRRVVAATAQRFLMPEAVSAMLTAAIGDERALHSSPDHPVRVLGEMGRRIDPLYRTTFQLRGPIIEAANRWLEEDPSPARQHVWARVAAQQLDPHVEGVFPDSGSPMTIYLPGGVESEEHIVEIGTVLWPKVRERLPLLETRALALLTTAVRELAEIVRGYSLRGGKTPPPEASAAAGGVLGQMFPEFDRYALTRPGLGLALHRIRKSMRVGSRQPLDPEFRLLSTGWDIRTIRNQANHLDHAIDRLVGRWLTESPPVVMARVAGWAKEAALAEADLDPVGRMALHRYAERGGDIDAAVTAALDAGLVGGEIAPLLRTGMLEGRSIPAWLPRLLSGPTRRLGLSVALDPGVDPRAAEFAIGELKDGDAALVETSALRHSRGPDGSDEVLLALLTHAVPAIRGAAALAFPTTGEASPPARSAALHMAWKQAFLDAPIAQGDTWELGQHLNQLATSDPELAVSWVVRQATDGAALWRLGFERKLDLSTMPRANRDDLVRQVPQQHRGEVLGLVLGEGRDWAEELVADGVISIGDVLLAIVRDSDDGITASEALAWAPMLVRHGANESDVLRLMNTGWTGPESLHYAGLRDALEAEQKPSDPTAEAVRQTGIERFGAAEREALERERRERVTGRIH